VWTEGDDVELRPPAAWAGDEDEGAAAKPQALQDVLGGLHCTAAVEKRPRLIKKLT